MVQSQFSLLWDSYKSNICSGFANLQQNGELVDMTLAADGHFVKVHQVLIALSSTYLKQLILSAPCQHPVIFLNNVSHATLSLILEYIYTGEVLVQSANLPAFIEAAKSLHIKGLESVVESSGIRGDKLELELDQTSLVGPHSSKGENNISKKISLPATARKVFVKHENINNEAGSSEDISSYSFEVDDHHNDSDDNINSQIVNKADKSKVTSSNLQFTVSIRGSLQVILNRYIYNLHSTQATGVRRWRCIDYRNRKCMAFLVTKGSLVINRANPHNHSFHDKKILDKIEKNAVYSALDDVQSYIENEKAKDRDEPMESDQFVSLELKEGLNNYAEECKFTPPILKDTSMKAKKFLQRYAHIFSSQEGNLGRTSVVQHRIDTGSERSIRQRARRIPIAKEKEVEGLLEDLRRNKIIEPVILCAYIPNENLREKYELNPAVKKLQEYVQIDTSGSKNLDLSTDFWRRQADELGLDFAVYRPRGLPICVMTLKGNRPELPSIMLNSHADVVVADEEVWTYPPFSGHLDENGNLYGRGTQDTKDIGIQYIEAIRKLLRNNVTLDRTIHVTVMPDEETGGFMGMTPFVETQDFKSLNIGFALDEGYPSNDDVMFVSYQDKRPWRKLEKYSLILLIG
ncbi:uncharacterized protein LOC123655861 [Melitaea cinxia]|uniref:uncharacterized protein LOC123655861 n=1 Tax=Melitaea cinxia TaxID=113334 RepID=UPI001E2744B7|nr:uncharacterized protein LOC123655861 [Melitaea cinxia]